MDASISNSPGRLAGIDYGRVRIGIALSDREQRLASPFENYSRRAPQADAQHFKNLAQQEQIAQFVVGLPVHLHGGESELSTEARKFGLWLSEVTGVPVVFFDERFSTSEASELLAEAGLSRRERKARLDKLAAQIMLTAYLESRSREQGAQRSLNDP